MNTDPHVHARTYTHVCSSLSGSLEGLHCLDTPGIHLAYENSRWTQAHVLHHPWVNPRQVHTEGVCGVWDPLPYLREECKVFEAVITLLQWDTDGLCLRNRMMGAIYHSNQDLFTGAPGKYTESIVIYQECRANWDSNDDTYNLEICALQTRHTNGCLHLFSSEALMLQRIETLGKLEASEKHVGSVINKWCWRIKHEFLEGHKHSIYGNFEPMVWNHKLCTFFIFSFFPLFFWLHHGNLVPWPGSELGPKQW